MGQTPARFTTCNDHCNAAFFSFVNIIEMSSLNAKSCLAKVMMMFGMVLTGPWRT